MRILVIGGHPGDPEAGCGGTMARYARMGHSVTALYLTRGEAGVAGKTHDQAAAIRTAEAQKACSVLKATALFAGQIDAATEVNPARSAEFTKLVASVDPHVVFTQWPVDTHADHRACASLTIAAWIALGRKFGLYYYEVDLGSDTQCFKPTRYVDVIGGGSGQTRGVHGACEPEPAGVLWAGSCADDAVSGDGVWKEYGGGVCAS